MDARDLALERSGGHCEVMVHVNGVWTRCGKVATDVHHMLPRSRGGATLDRVGESYHLVCLDRHHHNFVHAHPAWAYQGGLTIDGQCFSELGDRVVYLGTDEYLSHTYQRGA